jgi:hypothetical protein
MTRPANLDDLDRLLTCACDDLNVAAGAASIVGDASSNAFKRILADALVRVWDARDMIHAERPDLKPEFVREAEANPAACDAYFAASKAAHDFLAVGQVARAAEVLESFAASTTSAFFALYARSAAASRRGAI